MISQITNKGWLLVASQISNYVVKSYVSFSQTVITMTILELLTTVLIPLQLFHSLLTVSYNGNYETLFSKLLSMCRKYFAILL